MLRSCATHAAACTMSSMELPFVVILFLVLAVLLAAGIVLVVALPHLKSRNEEENEEHDPRHSSRTRR